MIETIAAMDSENADIGRQCPQRLVRLLLAPVIALILLGGLATVVDSPKVVFAQAPTWHGFSPSGWTNTAGVSSSVFLTSTVAPLQATAHYSVSLNSGSIWIGPYTATLTKPAVNRWRFETGLIAFNNGQNNRVRFSVKLTGGQRVQSNAYTVRVDTEAPAVTITTPQAGSVISAASLAIQGTATDAPSGIKSVTVKVTNQVVTPTLALPTWSATWPAPIEDGTAYTVTARGEDWAGHTITNSVTFTVDRVAPTNPTTITETHGIPSGAVLSSPMRVNFEWSGAQDGSGISGYFVYWGTEANSTDGVFVTSPTYAPPPMTQAGRYYLRISTKDLAGNTEHWLTVFTIILESTTRKVFLPLISAPPRWAIFEPNNTLATAYGPLENGRTYEAFIWPVGDQDYYYIDVTSTTTDITVNLTNIPAGADYDLYLYNATATLVASSAHYGSVDESIRYRPQTAGRYFIRIYPYQGANKDQPYRLKTTFQ